MADFVQLFISGLATGGIYALTAVGFTLLWQTSQTINFAQGEFVMLPAFFVLIAMGYLLREKHPAWDPAAARAEAISYAAYRLLKERYAYSKSASNTLPALDAHYDEIPHGLATNYEDWKPGWGSPYGIANTHDLTLWAFNAIPSNAQLVAMAGAAVA